MSNPAQLPCHVRIAMSQSRKDYAMFIKMSRDQQMDQMRQWSTEMKVPKPTQTKPIPVVTVRSVSLATDACDIGVTAVEAAIDFVEEGKKAVDEGTDFVPRAPQTQPTRPTLSPASPEQTRRSSARLANRQAAVEENCGGVHDGSDVAVDEEDNLAECDVLVLHQIGLEEKLAIDVVEEGKKAVDEGADFVEDDHEVLQQIANMEKRLLKIWEQGPLQYTEGQAMKISIVEEKLTKAQGDNKYLESLLQVRDQDFARYVNLEYKQRRQTVFYAEKVDDLEEKVEDFEEMVEELKVQMAKKDTIIQEQQIKLDTLREADRMSKELSKAQKMLTNANLALISKQKKTKLVTAHSVEYIDTKPRPAVMCEMAMARDREKKMRQTMQKDEITVLVATVDRIAASYDRYKNVSTIITFSEPRSDVVPDHLFTWVEKDMIALWLFSVEATIEEKEKYEMHLEKQMRPEPIYSPTLTKAIVNWHRLNPNIKRNLPVPVQHPLHGCALDPEFYTTMASASYYLGEKRDSILLYESGKPFGSLFGFWTSKGVLSPPDEPVGGYHCCPETGTWIIAAEGG